MFPNNVAHPLTATHINDIRFKLLIFIHGVVSRSSQEQMSDIFHFILTRRKNEIRQSINSGKSSRGIFYSEQKIIQTLGDQSRNTERAQAQNITLSNPVLSFSSIIYNSSSPLLLALSPLLLLSSLPLLFSCYLSTRPWHLSLRSVAPSVALGWWMRWWTLGCHGNLMDGLATDTSAERAHQHTHTHIYPRSHTHGEHTLLSAYAGPWLWDQQTSDSHYSLHNKHCWPMTAAPHICPIISSLLLTTLRWWSETGREPKQG